MEACEAIAPHLKARQVVTGFERLQDSGQQSADHARLYKHKPRLTQHSEPCCDSRGVPAHQTKEVVLDCHELGETARFLLGTVSFVGRRRRCGDQFDIIRARFIGELDINLHAC